MKIKLTSKSRSAYALVIVLIMATVSMIILGGTLSRVYGVAKMNNRAIELMNAQNAAEAAVERVFAQMQYDFQVNGGSGRVTAQLNTYKDLYPSNGEDSYWGKFQFSDAQGNNNKTQVYKLMTYTGNLPQAYSNRFTSQAPVYRIVSNAKVVQGSSGVTGTAQEDVMLALVPLTAYAIFYNSLLEFSTCATMVVNGAVHCNTNIDVGAGSSATLTFNTTVTSSGTVTAPTNNGASWTNWANFNSGWRTTFNGTSNFVTGLGTVQISIPMTNTHSLIDIPATNDSATIAGQQRLYNQAQVILIVSNSTISGTNATVVAVKVQKAPTAADVPGADGSPTINVYTNPTPAFLSTNLPFLSLTNRFYDTREDSTNNTTQIDIGKYKVWLTNSTSPVVGKFPSSGANGYPTILFVADNRVTNSLAKLDVVRITNGISPPVNGGQGFSIATPNPLYVWGNYNETNNSLLGSSNTSSGTVPCAFMSDALTILSANWNDSNSLHNDYDSSVSTWNASSTNTVNAAILTGIVPSTGTDNMHFSGGVHNLPRLLEDWSSSTLVLNTSIINLYNSTQAKGQFINPGTYYEPPTRKFSYDNNFSDPTKVPPGMPCALVALRWNWATPPPGTISYNVSP